MSIFLQVEFFFDKRFLLSCDLMPLMLCERGTSSDGSGSQTLGFEFWKCHGEMGLRLVEQGIFFIFCYIFGIFDVFSKVEHVQKALRNFKKSWNMPKIWQKMKKIFLLELPLKSIFRIIPSTRKFSGPLCNIQKNTYFEIPWK